MEDRPGFSGHSGLGPSDQAFHQFPMRARDGSEWQWAEQLNHVFVQAVDAAQVVGDAIFDPKRAQGLWSAHRCVGEIDKAETPQRRPRQERIPGRLALFGSQAEQAEGKVQRGVP